MILNENVYLTICLLLFFTLTSAFTMITTTSKHTVNGTRNNVFSLSKTRAMGETFSFTLKLERNNCINLLLPFHSILIKEPYPYQYFSISCKVSNQFLQTIPVTTNYISREKQHQWGEGVIKMYQVFWIMHCIVGISMVCTERLPLRFSPQIVGFIRHIF